MEYFVYILFSEKLNRFYIGTTDDPVKRLCEHNSAHYSNAYTAKGIPWTLFHTIPCTNSQQAYDLERFIRSMKSAVFIRNLKEDPAIISRVFERLSNKEK